MLEGYLLSIQQVFFTQKIKKVNIKSNYKKIAKNFKN